MMKILHIFMGCRGVGVSGCGLNIARFVRADFKNCEFGYE